MNNRHHFNPLTLIMVLAALTILIMIPGQVRAQKFDFDRLHDKLNDYTVILDMKIEISFGMQTNEQEQRVMGTIVTEDGLVLFDGSFLESDNPLSAISGMTFKTTPTKIEITALDGDKYEGEYVGVDDYTNLGFVRIIADNRKRFKPVEFVGNQKFTVGDWLALYILLPEFVDPPLAADIGMISLNVKTPEEFPLTVGFSLLEAASVLYNENLVPVGVLGPLMNPANDGESMFMESFDNFELPLLGVITADRLEKLIANPPQKGEVERAWLGITLQALTPDIASFFNLEISGGIIVNEVVKSSPAENAGLQVGDMIVEINGLPVEIDKDELIPIFQRRIADMGAGAAVEFMVLRPSEDKVDTLRLFANLEQRPMGANEAEEYENKTLEFKVRNLVFSDYLFYNLNEDELSGVVVSEITMGGLANIGGLLIGDVIQQINSSPVTSVEEIKEAMGKIEEEKPTEVIFFIWRNNKTLFVNVKTDW
ncbi:MAG: PDZ domain-containing protein [Candidatus Zixiibacteriota bacterium]